MHYHTGFLKERTVSWTNELASIIWDSDNNWCMNTKYNNYNNNNNNNNNNINDNNNNK